MLAQKLMGAKVSAGGGGVNPSLKAIIDALGLGTNLKLCLDAGDSESYDPAIQTDKWLDTSGNGFDFYRGSGLGVDSADPTFNGVAGGLSSGEYWSFDGGDFFTYDSPVEAWMSALSADNAKWSCFFVGEFVDSTSNQAVFSTVNAPSAIGNGLSMRLRSTDENLVIVVGDGVNGATQLLTSGAAKTGLQFIGITYDEASTYTTRVGSAVNRNAINAAYLYPSTSGVASCRIGATSVTGFRFGAGTKLYCFAMWEGGVLSSENLAAIYTAFSARFA